MGARVAAGLAVKRASIKSATRKLDVLASLASSASGSVEVAFQAAGRTTRFTAPIANGQLRISRALTAAQARAGTGTLTLTYGGDARTQPDKVRLLAASRGAALKAKRPTIVKGRLTAAGTVTKRARGSIRVELRFDPAGATQTRVMTFKAPIVKGRYRLDKPLAAAVLSDMARSPAAPVTYLLFAGDKRNGVAGQSAFFELPASS